MYKRRGQFAHITEEDLRRLRERGMIRGYEVKNTAAAAGNKKPAAKRKNKYGAVRVFYDGRWFDSTKECNRYKHLLILLKAGLIGQLQLQVKYPLEVESQVTEDGQDPELEKITHYIADFVYIDAETGKTIVEDVKSDATRKLPAYRYKKSLMKALWGIKIIEV